MLMTAVNSAINRRRRIIVDRTLELPAPVVPSSREKPTKVRLDKPWDSKVEDEDSADGLVDTSSGDDSTTADEIALFKALEESPQDHTLAATIAETSKLQKTSQQAANEESIEDAREHSNRNVSDSSSIKRRRWAMWGGSKQHKATEQVTGAISADRDSPQGTSSTTLRGGKTREPRLWEQM